MASAPAAQAGSQTIVLESHDEKERISPLSVGSWVLYDFANTIFSLNIISQFFPLFITRNLQLADVWYAYPMSASLLIVALISPLLGSLSDRKGGKRIPWLIACTLLCVSMTAIMGVVSDLYIIIIALIVANIGYQTGLIFYDALLPSVSTTLNWGKISGLGVGLGYVGSLAGAFAVLPFVSMYGTNQATFLPTALLFLVFAIPCFLFVRERPSATHRLTSAKEGLTWRNSLAQTWRTIGETRQVPGLSNFLLANFFYSDALSTVIVAMGVYAVNAIGFGTALEVLAPATVAAIIGSLLFGLVTDRLTAKRSLVIALLIWVVVFLSAMFLTDKFLFQAFVAPLAGIALGGTWTAARTMMIELSPPARLGEFLGIYNLTGKISAVIGPLLWGTTLLILDPKVYGHFAYQVAIATLLVMVLIGLALHLRTPNIRRQRSPR